MSILNGIKGLLSSELVSGLAGQLGESNDGVQKAMGGIVPSLLGGLMGAKQEDHSMLGGLLSQAGNLGGGNLVGDLIGGLTGGGNANSGISGIGSSLISGLLGGKSGGMIDMIAKLAGIKSSSSSSLLGIGGSLIASFLGKKMLGDGGGISGIISSLMGEKKEIAAAAPSGIGSLLGLDNIFGSAQQTVGNVANAVGNTASGAASKAAGVVGSAASAVGGDDDSSGGGMKWLWPLLLLAALGLGAWMLLKNCNKSDADATTTPIENTGDTTNGGSAAGTATMTGTDATAATGAATGTATTDTGNKTATPAPAATPAPVSTKVKLANGTEISAYKGGVEDKLVAFLSDASAKLTPDDKSKDWFDFDNLNFDLGKSTITKASMVQIDNLAAILKAYPNLKIKVGGYTDKKGDDAGNKKLSQSRADAVFAALKAKGANPAQLTKAEGYGEELATVAESASDEERRKDRRTAVRVIAK
jgi:outer membrane protein OmpA-like peptidoglycan-associated protein